MLSPLLDLACSNIFLEAGVGDSHPVLTVGTIKFRCKSATDPGREKIVKLYSYALDGKGWLSEHEDVLQSSRSGSKKHMY